MEWISPMRPRRKSSVATSPGSTALISRASSRPSKARVRKDSTRYRHRGDKLTMTTAIDSDAVRKAAGSTRDPEIRRSLGELGLLDEVQIEGSRVIVHFHLTSPLCP